MNIKKVEEMNLISYLENAPESIQQHSGLTDWLQKSGFFTAPASTKYHGSFVGGLYLHSFSVHENLSEYESIGLVKWERPESPFIIGMYHDLCKIDAYKIEVNLLAGDVSIDYKRDSLIPGHGEKSLIYLMQHIKLTQQEIACIRWHMGAFDDEKMWKHYTQACKQYPEVLYTHTADMYASHCMGV